MSEVLEFKIYCKICKSHISEGMIYKREGNWFICEDCLPKDENGIVKTEYDVEKEIEVKE